MELIELGKKRLLLEKEITDQAQEELQKSMFNEIENCTNLDELKVFTKLNENYDFPAQITVKALEKRLVLGDNSPEGLNLYRWFLDMVNVPLVYKNLAQYNYDKLVQLRKENASETAYEELRMEVLERIKDYPSLNTYFS